MKDPEMYLKERNIALQCPVDPQKPAVLDAAHRAFVNHEVYFFSGRIARWRFQWNPLRWCGIVTDPVNHVRFQPTSQSPHVKFHGRPYYFTADSTLVAFEATPDSFALRRGM